MSLLRRSAELSRGADRARPAAFQRTRRSRSRRRASASSSRCRRRRSRSARVRSSVFAGPLIPGSRRATRPRVLTIGARAERIVFAGQPTGRGGSFGHYHAAGARNVGWPRPSHGNQGRIQRRMGGRGPRGKRPRQARRGGDSFFPWLPCAHGHQRQRIEPDPCTSRKSSK